MEPLGPAGVRRSGQAGSGSEGAREKHQHPPVSTRPWRRPPSWVPFSAPQLPSHQWARSLLQHLDQPGVQPSATALRSCPIRHAVQRPSGPEPSAWQTQLFPHLPARPGPAPRASPLTPLLAPQRPGPSASGSGKSGCGQGSAGCDLSRARTTLPQFLHLDNRKGPFAPGYGMQPDSCFPNCSPGCLAPGARPGLSYGGTKKICGLWGPGWGQVEGRQATYTHRCTRGR